MWETLAAINHDWGCWTYHRILNGDLGMVNMVNMTLGHITWKDPGIRDHPFSDFCFQVFENPESNGHVNPLF